MNFPRIGSWITLFFFFISFRSFSASSHIDRAKRIMKTFHIDLFINWFLSLIWSSHRADLSVSVWTKKKNLKVRDLWFSDTIFFMNTHLSYNIQQKWKNKQNLNQVPKEERKIKKYFFVSFFDCIDACSLIIYCCQIRILLIV